MFVAVVPVKNEAANLERVVANISACSPDLIIPVLNGCTDNSLAVLEQLPCRNLAPLCFEESLGIDVPRAVGALAARRLAAGGVLFVDGDMTGAGSPVLESLLDAVRTGKLDLALTNCYPAYAVQQLTPQASCLLALRKKLNQRLGLLHQIGSATPSHGPHAVSGRLLQLVEPVDFAIPPLLLVRAARHGLKIGLAAEIPHAALGSPSRGDEHARLIMETIIGDCLCALQMKNGRPGSRSLEGREYTGYHDRRRFDLLAAFAAGRLTGRCQK